MKISIVAILLVMPSIINGQVTVSGNPIAYSKTITLDSSKSATSLYLIGFEWFATHFVDSKSVIQMQDKEAGIIIGKGVTTAYTKGGSLVPPQNLYVSYTIKMVFKQGSVKYEIGNFLEDSYGVIKDGEFQKPSYKMIKKIYGQIVDQVKSSMTSTAASIDTAFKE